MASGAPRGRRRPWLAACGKCPASVTSRREVGCASARGDQRARQHVQPLAREPVAEITPATAVAKSSNRPGRSVDRAFRQPRVTVASRHAHRGVVAVRPADRPADQAGRAAWPRWREPVTIDTYLPEPPDRYPAYLDRRVYQGSSGRVYPLPFHDRIDAADRPRRDWDAVHLENEWLRVMILPELGGRIHVGYDKTQRLRLLLSQPGDQARAGRAGRAVDRRRRRVQLAAAPPPGDLPADRRRRSSDARRRLGHGVVLRPRPDRPDEGHARRAAAPGPARDRAAGRGSTTAREEPQTFLWWANVAAKVHDDYQSFFPPDVRIVADHAKRAVTAFPAADGPTTASTTRARGWDRAGRRRTAATRTMCRATGSTGTATSRCRPRTCAWAAAGDFFGGYDHAAEAGFVHVADHHYRGRQEAVDLGQRTVRLRLGPQPRPTTASAYIELMAGVFTDNQPDFSFLAPGRDQDVQPVLVSDPEDRPGPGRRRSTPRSRVAGGPRPVSRSASRRPRPGATSR